MKKVEYSKLTMVDKYNVSMRTGERAFKKVFESLRKDKKWDLTVEDSDGSFCERDVNKQDALEDYVTDLTVKMMSREARRIGIPEYMPIQAMKLDKKLKELDLNWSDIGDQLLTLWLVDKDKATAILEELAS
jgi:hypothetical protein